MGRILHVGASGSLAFPRLECRWVSVVRSVAAATLRITMSSVSLMVSFYFSTIIPGHFWNISILQEEFLTWNHLVYGSAVSSIFTKTGQSFPGGSLKTCRLPLKKPTQNLCFPSTTQSQMTVTRFVPMNLFVFENFIKIKSKVNDFWGRVYATWHSSWGSAKVEYILLF